MGFDIRKRNRGKTRRKSVIFLAVIAAFILICAVFFRNGISKLWEPIYYSFDHPVPDGINQNFLTQVDDCFIPAADAYGYDLRVTTGFRSMADQSALYDQGRTVDGHIVTEAQAGSSIHNYGYAVDVTDRWKGYDIDWNQLVAIGAYCGLESGGPGDLPHFEHRAGLTMDDFKDGMRPPSLTLPCPVMAERAASTSTPLTLDDLKQCDAPDFSSL